MSFFFFNHVFYLEPFQSRITIIMNVLCKYWHVLKTTMFAINTIKINPKDMYCIKEMSTLKIWKHHTHKYKKSVEIFIFGTLAARNQYVMPLDFDYQMFQNFNVMSFTNAINFASLLIIRLTNIIMVSQVMR